MAFYNDIFPLLRGEDGITLALDPSDGTIVISVTGGTLGVTKVSGYPGQIKVTGATNPIVSIDPGYLGQNTIQTLGLVTSGIWQAGNVITPQLSITSPPTNISAISFVAPSNLPSSFGYTLPSLLGSSNQILILNDNSGTLGWKNFSLSKLTDCNTASAGLNQLLVYNSYWEPYTLNGTGFVFDSTANTITLALSGLSADTSINLSTLANKQVLSTGTDNTQKWKNVFLSLKDGYLSDVSITSPAATNQLLQYNGTAWVNNSNLTLSGALLFQNAGSSNFVSIQIPALSTSSVYTLPQSTGSLNQLLGITVASTNSNSLSWVTPQLSYLGGDIQTSGASNYQLLFFTTYKSLNKWVPYTLAGATINDDTRTITVTATGSVTSINGKPGQITVDTTVNGTPSTPTIGIDPNYQGQSTISKLGTITSGVWNGSLLSVGYGGTGNNSCQPYCLVAGGTGNTSPLQYVPLGSVGQVLISGNQSILPSWSPVTMNNNGDNTGNIWNVNDFYCTKLILQNSGYYIVIMAPTLSVTSIYVLPSTVGNPGDVLTILNNVNNTGILGWNTPSTGSLTLSGLTDCSVSGVANDQVLVYTTAGSLNKWVPYTLSGATFNDSKRTITVTASTGVASVSGTPGQITRSGSAQTPTIGIDPNYTGQSSINTLGTITSTSAVWQAQLINVAWGGTGNNSCQSCALVAGGRGSTSPLQYVTWGSSKQLLTTGDQNNLPYWVTPTLSGGYIGDVNVPSPVAGQYLGYNGSQWVNSNPGILRISNILFVNATNIGTSRYNLPTGFDVIVLDTTNVSPVSDVYLPMLSGNGTQHLCLQVVGNNPNPPYIGTYFPGYILYDQNNNLTSALFLSNNTTYLFTYYQNIAQPYYTTQIVGGNIAQLKGNGNIDIYLLYTNNYHSITANLGLPFPVVNGQTFWIKDVNGFINTTKIQLCSTGSNLINGQGLYTYSNSGLSQQFVYLGGTSSGTNGNFMTL